MQLAMLVNMGFDAVKAEQALEVNGWNVDQSIDYLICRGIVLNDASVVSNDDAKSVERRIRDSISPSIPVASNDIETSRESGRERHDQIDARRSAGTRGHPGENWRDEPTPTTRRHHRHDLHEDHGVDSTALSPPHHDSHPYHVSWRDPYEEHTSGRRQQELHPSNGLAETAYEERSHDRQRPKPRRQRKPRVHQEDIYGIDEDGFPVDLEKNRVLVAPAHSFEDRLAKGFSIAGVPTMVSDIKADGNKGGASYPGVEAVYGVGLPPSKQLLSQSTSRRQVGDEDASSVNAVAECRPLDSPSSEVEIASPSDEDRTKRDIRRLYILVFIAILIVLVGIGVTVGLVVKQQRDEDKNATPPDTTTPVPAPTESTKTNVPAPTTFTTTVPTTPSPTSSSSPTDSPIASTSPPAKPSTPTNRTLSLKPRTVRAPTASGTPSQTLPPVKETSPTPSPSAEFSRRLEDVRLLRHGRRDH